jgi:hypothetical protein
MSRARIRNIVSESLLVLFEAYNLWVGEEQNYYLFSYIFNVKKSRKRKKSFKKSLGRLLLQRGRSCRQVPDRAGSPLLRHPWPSLQETVGALRPQREPTPRLPGNAGLS